MSQGRVVTLSFMCAGDTALEAAKDFISSTQLFPPLYQLEVTDNNGNKERINLATVQHLVREDALERAN